MKRKKIAVMVSGLILSTVCSFETGVFASEGVLETCTGEVQTVTSDQTEASSGEIDAARLKSTLDFITSQKRGAGSEGEAKVVSQAEAFFQQYGYETSRNSFEGEGRSFNGEYKADNLIAVKKADQENADILIVSAHIDSIATTTGACDNASGSAIVMETAAALAAAPSNLEVRFILFSGEEDGLLGSEAYVNSLSEEEKSRIVGDIQSDMLGEVGVEGLRVCTVDGQENVISSQLASSIEAVTGNAPDIRSESASDHTSFHQAGILSALFTQNGEGTVFHHMIDTEQAIDMDQLDTAATVLVHAVSSLMSGNPQKQVSTAAGKLAYDKLLPLRDTLETTEKAFGGAFKATGEKTADLDVNQGMVYWFGLDKPMTTDINTMDGQSQEVVIHPAEQGYTEDEIKNAILEYVDPRSTVEENEGGLSVTDWAGGKYYEIIETDDESFQVQVNSYNIRRIGETAYSLMDGALTSSAMDARTQKVWDDVLSKVIPEQYRTLLGQIGLYTDGIRNELASTETVEEGNNTSMSLRIDEEDAFLPDGSWRDFKKTVMAAIHEFGHVLEDNSTQVTLDENGDDKTVGGFGTYLEGSYGKAFDQTFYSEESDSSKPDRFVDEYAATAMGEDFAECFMHFVWMDQPQGDTIADQKVRFFYQFDELTELRDQIRANFDFF